jgi:hypothetical protein
MEDRAGAVGLFRYSLVRDAADPGWSARQRGSLVRTLASEAQLGPDGDRVRVSRNTVDRWIRAYRAGGFEALVPGARRHGCCALMQSGLEEEPSTRERTSGGGVRRGELSRTL